MTERDVADVAAIEAVAQPRPWSEALFRAELALADQRCYRVAHVDGRLVGYGGTMITATEAHVTTVAVRPDHRRRGVAVSLLVALARDAAGRDVDDLTLEVRVSNRAAQSLYRRLGFSAEGVRPSYYADNGEDAVIMWARGIRTDAYRSLLARLERWASATGREHR